MARSNEDAKQAEQVAASDLVVRVERLREQLAAAEEELEVFSRLTSGYWWAAERSTVGAGEAEETTTVRAWVTQGFMAATGGDRALVEGLARGAGIHPEDRARYREVLDEVCRGPGAGGREQALHEFRLFGADASILWVRQRLEGRRGTDGSRRLYASGELITERKRAEDALGHVEARFLSLVEHAPNVIITIDLAGTILFINRPVPSDAREPWELIGQSAFGLANVEDRDPLRAAVAQIVAGKQAHEFSLRGAAARADGEEPRWYEVQAAPVIRAGEVVAITMILTDVSERRRATQALRRSESRWRFLWENVPDLIAELDADGRVVHSNRDLAGYLPSSGVSGAAVDCPLRQGLELAARTGAPSSFELAHTDASGRERWYANRVVPLGETGGRGFLWIASDVSDRKDSERERADLEAQLRQQQKLESIGTLAGGVAHEINNPIQSIMNYADLVRLRAEPGGPIDEFAGEIIQETERVADIVRSLLAFARQEKQHHSPARLLDILGSTRTLMAAVLRRDHITLDIDVPADLPPIQCRSQQIQQVFMNLLGNARDALNARYPEFDEDKRIHVVARAFERDGETWVATTVEDHGVGISPQVIDRVFDPFFTTKGPHAGTGLGLSVSHGIVREHRGELEVESEPGAYTRFRLNLRVDADWDLQLD